VRWHLLALTLGVNTDVARLYTQLARDTGVGLTYFVNGTYRSWAENRDLLHCPKDKSHNNLGTITGS
jgi:peptidoglycan-N-acetylglucosamine deacetylase